MYKTENHVPTADRVARVFSGQRGFGVRPDDSSRFAVPEEEVEEEVEVIDFEDMQHFREEVEKLAVPLVVEEMVLAEVQVETREDAEVKVQVQADNGMVVGSEDTPDVNPQVDQKVQGDIEVEGEAGRSDELMEQIVQVEVPLETQQAIDAVQVQAESETIGGVEEATSQDDIPGFVVDTQPASPHTGSELAIEFDRVEINAPLGAPNEETEEDEVVVYPRSGKATPARRATPSPMPPATHTSSDSVQPNAGPSSSTQAYPPFPPPPSFDSISLSFASTSAATSRSPYKPSKRVQGLKKKERMRVKRRAEREAMFGSFGFGAALADERERDTGRDPRWDERRRGDSDVDWGDEGSDDGGGGGGEDGGMEVDQELDVGVLNRFIQGLSAGGSQWVTADDLEDEERMRQEDEEDEDSGSSDEDEYEDDAEVTEIMLEEEKLMVGEGGSVGLSDEEEEEEEEEEEDSSDEPEAGFHARLERIRERTRGKRPADVQHSLSDDEDEEEAEFDTWADKDELFIANIKVRSTSHSLANSSFVSFVYSQSWTRMTTYLKHILFVRNTKEKIKRLMRYTTDCQMTSKASSQPVSIMMRFGVLSIEVD